VWERYCGELKSLSEEGKVNLPVIPAGRESNYHIFFFRVKDEETRNVLLDGLRDQGIGATFHYIPLHSSPFGMRQLDYDDKLPITEECSKTLVRLPIWPGITCDSCVLVGAILAEIMVR